METYVKTIKEFIKCKNKISLKSNFLQFKIKMLKIPNYIIWKND